MKAKLARCASRRHNPVPLGNMIRSGDLRVLGGSGGVRVFVDQTAQDGSSVDPCAVEVGHGGAGRVTTCVGDMLSDALLRVPLHNSMRAVSCGLAR